MFINTHILQGKIPHDFKWVDSNGRLNDPYSMDTNHLYRAATKVANTVLKNAKWGNGSKVTNEGVNDLNKALYALIHALVLRYNILNDDRKRDVQDILNTLYIHVSRFNIHGIVDALNNEGATFKIRYNGVTYANATIF